MTRYVGIDPSTKTGMVILDQEGNYIDGFEIIIPETDNKITKATEIVEAMLDNLEPNDVVAIEGFSYGSKGKDIDFQFGVGYAIRMELYRQEMNWIDVAPTQVKKFATGNHQVSKENMIIPILRHWNFEHPSNNVRDAYVLAQIARSIKVPTVNTKYQEDVIQAILAPKKSKRKRA